MKIKAIRCPRCKDIIYSRARHDFRWCSCKLIGVDGGFDYTKYIMDVEKGNKYGLSPTNVLQIEIEVNATVEELYKDWNESIDKYGIIKNV